MKLFTPLMLVIIAINSHLYCQNNIDRDNHEPLSETPLYPIPAEMTFEEYQDMNRRMSLAVAWSSIPVPGITHYYAGEKKKAKQLFYIGLGGLACIIAGAGSEEEKIWPDTTGNLRDNYVIHNEGQDNEKWFERIPVSMEGDVLHYDLKEVRKEPKGGGGLIALGVLVLVGDFVYDRLWGFQKIEEKRDRVRYKYGQKLQFSIKPKMEPLAGGFGLSLNVQF
ncbi:MAG: hypothetical protein VX744_02370 [Candidatus Neomarinimicrobiota bacterium]|nr:hypothetical protein [Candidatus Neomarinimicrobiota bacterium]